MQTKNKLSIDFQWRQKFEELIFLLIYLLLFHYHISVVVFILFKNLFDIQLLWKTKHSFDQWVAAFWRWLFKIMSKTWNVFVGIETWIFIASRNFIAYYNNWGIIGVATIIENFGYKW